MKVLCVVVLNWGYQFTYLITFVSHFERSNCLTRSLSPYFGIYSLNWTFSSSFLSLLAASPGEMLFGDMLHGEMLVAFDFVSPKCHNFLSGSDYFNSFEYLVTILSIWWKRIDIIIAVMENLSLSSSNSIQFNAPNQIWSVTLRNWEIQIWLLYKFMCITFKISRIQISVAKPRICPKHHQNLQKLHSECNFIKNSL